MTNTQQLITAAIKSLDLSPESTKQKFLRSLLTTALYLANQFDNGET